MQIAGWLYNLRKSGKIVFPQLRDGTGIMQCVAVKSELPEEVFETLKHLTQESSLVLTGKVRAEPRAHGRLRAGHQGVRGAAARPRRRSVPDHAERARHRVPDGPPASVAAQPAPARDHSRPRTK